MSMRTARPSSQTVSTMGSSCAWAESTRAASTRTVCARGAGFSACAGSGGAPSLPPRRR